MRPGAPHAGADSMMADTPELTCRDLTAFLDDYVAGELGVEERARFDEHLAECPDCLAYLASYVDTVRRAKDAYRDDPVPGAIPEPLVRAILAARDQDPSTAPPRRPRRRR